MAVTIRANIGRKNLAYGEHIDLEVRIRNGQAKRVFVVTEPYIWNSSRTRLNVYLAEAALSRGLCYYDYDPPKRRMVKPGQETVIRLQIGMPPRAGSFDSNGHYVWRATPVAGNVTVEITVGYLSQPFRPQTSAPWAEFLDQQSLTAKKRLRLRVATR